MENDPGSAAYPTPASRAPGASKSAANQPGGTVAPASRAAVARQLYQTPAEPPATHYELRDPFAEVTYRSKTFAEMSAKADQLGAIRFTSVDPSGQRTPVNKVEGVWKTTEHKSPDQAPSAANETPRSAAEQRDQVRSTSSPKSSSGSRPSLDVAASTTTPPPTLASLDEKAVHAARAARLQAELHERYIIKRPLITAGDVSLGHTEYRFRGDKLRVAFTESPLRLSTDTNNPAVVRSMVDVAEAHNWRALRVSGNEDFKRLVWLEASVRGIQTVGYTPHRADMELMQKEREARHTNRIERSNAAAAIPSPGSQPAGDAATKSSVRGSGGRKTVLAALEAVLVANRVPQKQREAVMTAAAENLAQRLSRGEVHKVKVYDPAAPSQRPSVTPAPQPQRTRERAAPAR